MSVHHSPRFAFAFPAVAGMVVMLGVLVFAMTPRDVAAHAALLETVPTANEVLPDQPEALILRFNEPVSLTEEGLRLFLADSSEIPLEGAVVDREVKAALPAGLVEGSYVLSWRVISADGHPISGALPFAIGHASAGQVNVPAANHNRAVEIGVGLSQGLGYIGLLATIGLLAFPALVLRRWDLDGISPAHLRVVSGFATVGIVAFLVQMPLTVARQQGMGLGWLVSRPSWGGDVPRDLVLMTALAILGMAGAAWGAPRWRSSWGQRAILTLSLVMATAAPSVLGHTRIVHPTWGIVLSNLVHVAVGAFWFGGLIALVLALRDQTTVARGARSAVEPAMLITRFSVVGGILVALLSVSGMVSAVMILGSIRALVDTTYGRLLLIKSGIAIAVLVVAAWNHFQLVPSIRSTSAATAWEHLRRSVRIEIALLVLVLFTTGFLVNQSPREAEATPSQIVTNEPIAFEASLGGSAMVHGEITPGTTGSNTISLYLMAADGAAIEPQSPPQIQLTLASADLGPLTTSTEAGNAPGAFTGTVEFPLSGEWTISIPVRVSTFEEPIGTVTIVIP